MGSPQQPDESPLTVVLLNSTHHLNRDKMVEWTMQLNNILQQVGEKKYLAYEASFDGPDNDGLWKFVAKYKGMEIGKGSARAKMAAKEQASMNGLKTLYPAQYEALTQTP